MADVEPVAELHQVSYLYPGADRWALKDVSLTLRRGEFVGVIGPTGAGKTTLCLALTGIVPQFYGGRFFGYVRVAGMDTLEHPISRLASRVGVVLEDPETQITATSVENEVAFALENLGVPRDVMRRRIDHALAAVRLAGMEARGPHTLSGGEKQRLAIAAALALQPALLVLDEPTSQLDAMGRQEVFETVRRLNRELGVTVLMASHAAEEMAAYADRLLLLVEGKIAAFGTPGDVYGQVPLLQQHGVRPPQVAAIFHRMREAGFAVPSVPVRLSEGLDALRRYRPSPAASGDPLPRTANVTAGPASLNMVYAGVTPLISMRDVHYTYANGTTALSGISLDVQPGEYVAIVGQNGAGKSTLVKHMLNVLTPTKGAVLIGGVDAGALKPGDLARRIGYVAQNPDSQIFNNTVADEVSFALEALGYDGDEIESRVSTSLRSMGLLAVRGCHPLSLPKGDRARVVIAAVLAMAPDVVIFDEPTTGQDYLGARHILEVSRRLHDEGKTVMVITHHLHLLPGYAERVLVMGKGTILLDAGIRTALGAGDLLRSTYLAPSQVVRLAQALGLGEKGPLPLTPAELVDVLAGRMHAV